MRLQVYQKQNPHARRYSKVILNKRLRAQAMQNQSPPAHHEVRPSQKSHAIQNLIFYLGLTLTLFAVLTFLPKKDAFSLFGYSFYNILTPSMDPYYPVGSLIIAKHLSPDKIQIGDDITFFKDKDTIITHRVIDIYPNYQNSGQIAFQTKGIANPQPDSAPVYATNVLGTVKQSIPSMGNVFLYIREHIHLLFSVAALLFIIVYSLKVALGWKSSSAP